ncbi:MAG: PTS fructose transporter subunit IIB [Anaerorhabdus sp.]|uniref:PTS fructose transporter subunit IIB n=1 Tax=Anaerorhabdus sp. TaxID=1872524 RepID=UPI002B393295|nr:PTS fructose transporter subunit IIB [Erysipelotrichales bacterium]
MKIVIVTACATGVAHSRMCAVGLKNEAEKRGHKTLVEMQGGHNMTAKLSYEQCQEADIIIIAYATAIDDMERFKNKLVLKLPISDAIKNIEKIIDKAEELVC